MGGQGSSDAVGFLHAHPDDEAIFTGGTLALLADRGVRTVVFLATGDAGRRREAEVACRELGVSALHFLHYADSGAEGAAAGTSFASADTHGASRRLGKLIQSERLTSMVLYDEGGIYSHPDHLAVHRVGTMAARLAGLSSVYEATVDREYLHFVETHLVGEAVSWLVGEENIASLNRAPLGVPTVLVTNTVDVRSVAARKRAAMLAHESQIPSGSSVHDMDADTFDAVYGYEWFIRRGAPGVIDLLG